MKKHILLFLTVLLAAAGLTSCNREEPTIVTPPPPPLAAIRINEVYSRGDSLNPDWIEIYNPNTTAITIGGYKVYDNGGLAGSKPKKEIAAGTSLPGMSWMVINVDTADASGFGLSSSGETVWLENASGAVVDSIALPALGIDTSYARTPDGASVWARISLPTKGVANVVGGPVQPLVLNEVFSRGIATDPDWIEIYNPNTAPVTLTGYLIYDGGGNAGTKPKMPFPAGAFVPANGFYVIVTDVTTEPYGFGLGSGGDEVWLENAGGTVIDRQVIPAMPVTTTSYCRIPNGSATWQISNTITRGASNQP
ncbi:MAG: lamin tail domain-containing protein [Bacteroidetes bacterium]|jgi:LEA14-like dessication related protein|nr:lamin tail domain-containing protein [Bacteroidota bacterium]